MDTPELIERACNAFRQQVGKQATLRAGPEIPNPTLAFRPKGAKFDRIYAADPVPGLDAAAVARLIRARDPNKNRIVIAHFVPQALATKLKDAGIHFMDIAGNAHLAEPGFFLFIAGCPPPPGLIVPAPARAPRAFNTTGLKVLFVLLARPEYVDRPYRDIADAAGVALGTVAGFMGDMKALGYLIDLGKEGKRLQQRERLIEEWTAAYAREIFPRRRVRRFRAENPDWWKTADIRPFGILWGGDVAGDRLTGHLKPGEITVYANGLPGPLLQAQRMRADPQGDFVIIDAFWKFPPADAEAANDTVPPLLVYADLMATADPRAIETAGLIHEEYLAGPDGKD